VNAQYQAALGAVLQASLCPAELLAAGKPVSSPGSSDMTTSRDGITVPLTTRLTVLQSIDAQWSASLLAAIARSERDVGFGFDTAEV